MNLAGLKFILVIVGLLLIAITTSGQDISTNISGLNEALGSSYIVSNKEKILLVDGFRNGEQVKSDKVNIFDLDMETLSYSETDASVFIKCYSDLDGCVTTTLMRERNKKSYKARIVFGTEDVATGNEVLNRLQQLINEMVKTY